jgi:hypothetical protein
VTAPANKNPAAFSGRVPTSPLPQRSVADTNHDTGDEQGRKEHAEGYERLNIYYRHSSLNFQLLIMEIRIPHKKTERHLKKDFFSK